MACLSLIVGLAALFWRIQQKNPYRFPKGGGGKRVKISQYQPSSHQIA